MCTKRNDRKNGILWIFHLHFIICLYLVYLLWMFIPDGIFHDYLNIYYFLPILVNCYPKYVVVLMIYANIMVFGLQLVQLPTSNSTSYIVDSFSQIEDEEEHWNTKMKPFTDVPLWKLHKNQ